MDRSLGNRGSASTCLERRVSTVSKYWCSCPWFEWKEEDMRNPASSNQPIFQRNRMVAECRFKYFPSRPTALWICKVSLQTWLRWPEKASTRTNERERERERVRQREEGSRVENTPSRARSQAVWYRVRSEYVIEPHLQFPASWPGRNAWSYCYPIQSRAGC